MISVAVAWSRGSAFSLTSTYNMQPPPFAGMTARWCTPGHADAYSIQKRRRLCSWTAVAGTIDRSVATRAGHTACDDHCTTEVARPSGDEVMVFVDSDAASIFQSGGTA